MKTTIVPRLLAIALVATTATGVLAGGSNHEYPFQKKNDKSHQDFKKYFNQKYFSRVATFPVYQNLDVAGGDEHEDTTSAEISAVSSDGNVVYYSDSPKERVGLINITDAKNPLPAGIIQLDGEPTSVAVEGKFLLVAVNTSASFLQPSGKLSVYSLHNPLSPKWISDLDMQGQPDAIAVSPDGRYAAIAIENERDEDLNDGFIPQLPSGHLMVVKMKGHATKWQASKVDLTGYADIAPNDPEPEYVAINRANIAAVTLQENNHIILVDLHRGKVIGDFSAGTADLIDVDTVEDDVINPVDIILDRRREPDAITWVNDWWLATANEGDYEDENGEAGGSRGFTIFNIFGQVKYESGSSFEHELIRAGHYPESRSENKGVEPESVIAQRFGRDNYLFVGSERGNAVGVYKLGLNKKPSLHQILPTGVGPEGLLAVPQRNLLIVSSEEDAADDGIRSTVAIYQYGSSDNEYPQIQSDAEQLIPWSALSGMVADIEDNNTLYAVPDSYYAQSRIFSVDVTTKPATINNATVLHKDGATVNYDLEGIAQRADGSFWLVSEGNGSSRPNLLIAANADGVVTQEISLPAAVVAKVKSNGFEGVAVVGEGEEETVVIAFQREWKGDADGLVRIGFYQPANDQWTFAYYPIDAAPAGAWVGLSELTAVNDNTFVVIERDNQSGTDAKIKRLYQFSTEAVVPVAEGEAFPILTKTLVKDVLPELKSTNGWVLDKLEGTAITKDGKVYLVTDNDGVDDSLGETRFIDLGKLF